MFIISENKRNTGKLDNLKTDKTRNYDTKIILIDVICDLIVQPVRAVFILSSYGNGDRYWNL